jgi:hypothetical protein
MVEMSLRCVSRESLIIILITCLILITGKIPVHSDSVNGAVLGQMLEYKSRLKSLHNTSVNLMKNGFLKIPAYFSSSLLNDYHKALTNLDLSVKPGNPNWKKDYTQALGHAQKLTKIVFTIQFENYASFTSQLAETMFLKLVRDLKLLVEDMEKMQI